MKRLFAGVLVPIVSVRCGANRTAGSPEPI